MALVPELKDSSIETNIMRIITTILRWFRRGEYDLVMDRAFVKKLCFGRSTELTIVSGVIAPTGAYHTVDTESNGASDDLDTINATNFNTGDILILRPENDARTVVLKHGTGNLKLTGGDITLDDEFDTAMLLYDSVLGKWIKV
jgi:hypothetical protein